MVESLPDNSGSGGTAPNPRSCVAAEAGRSESRRRSNRPVGRLRRRGICVTDSFLDTCQDLSLWYYQRTFLDLTYGRKSVLAPMMISEWLPQYGLTLSRVSSSRYLKRQLICSRSFLECRNEDPLRYWQVRWRRSIGPSKGILRFSSRQEWFDTNR